MDTYVPIPAIEAVRNSFHEIHFRLSHPDGLLHEYISNANEAVILARREHPDIVTPERLREWLQALDEIREPGSSLANNRTLAACVILDQAIKTLRIETILHDHEGATPINAKTHPNGTPPTKSVRPTRSTAPGEAREKLIAALTKHHQYDDGGCLNFDAVGVRALSRLADVNEGSATRFFDDQFNAGQTGGHARYKRACRDKSTLIASLKTMRGEFRPGDFMDAASPEQWEAANDLANTRKALEE